MLRKKRRRLKTRLQFRLIQMVGLQLIIAYALAQLALHPRIVEFVEKQLETFISLNPDTKVLELVGLPYAFMLVLGAYATCILFVKLRLKNPVLLSMSLVCVGAIVIVVTVVNQGHHVLGQRIEDCRVRDVILIWYSLPVMALSIGSTMGCIIRGDR